MFVHLVNGSFRLVENARISPHTFLEQRGRGHTFVYIQISPVSLLAVIPLPPPSPRSQLLLLHLPSFFAELGFVYPVSYLFITVFGSCFSFFLSFLAFHSSRGFCLALHFTGEKGCLGQRRIYVCVSCHWCHLRALHFSALRQFSRRLTCGRLEPT